MKKRKKSFASVTEIEEFKRKKAPPLEPENEIQADYINSLCSCPYTIATGYAGTGKTYIPTRLASLWFDNGEIKKIVLSRPAVSASKSLGFFKGTKEEKMKQWLMPIWSTLLETFSESKLDTMIKYNQLEFVPLETIKGNSWKDCFIIVDEAEDCNIAEVKAILTRLGTNSTMVLCGDITQTDVKDSGLIRFLRLMDKSSKLKRFVSYVDFNHPSLIVRSEACREIILGFEEVGL